MELFSKALWTKVAFAAKYGHQQVTSILHLPVGRLDRFNNAIGDMMREEREATQRAMKQED